MAREKIKRIFNKNHITIEQIEHPEYCPYPEDMVVYENQTVSGPKYIWDYPKVIERTIRKVSKLGFYYDQHIKEYERSKSDRNKNDVREWIIINYKHEDTLYRLKFLIAWNENKVIKREDSLRPWEIAEGDHSLNDNMLKSLESDMNSFFERISFFKITSIGKRDNNSYKMDNFRGNISELKYEIFEYMFGNKNGIRFQTDMEKLLSHGFDPVYSFRKDKEKK